MTLTIHRKAALLAVSFLFARLAIADSEWTYSRQNDPLQGTSSDHFVLAGDYVAAPSTKTQVAALRRGLQSKTTDCRS